MREDHPQGGPEPRVPMSGSADWPDLQVQPSTIRMIRGVLRLERICFQEDAWPWVDVASILLWPSVVRLGAVDGPQLIGFVAGDTRWRPRTGMIATLAVHPSYRRRGVGRRLLAECEARLEAPLVRLTVRLDNLAAIALYESAGYQRRETLEGYYSRGVAGLLMEKVRNGSA